MKHRAFVGLALMVILGCTPQITTPVVTIPAGLRPRMTAAQVEQLVLEQIHGMEGIAGVVLRAPRVLKITAIAGGPAASGFDGVTWQVDAQGTCATSHGRGPATIPPAPTCTFEISDADGMISGFGFP